LSGSWAITGKHGSFIKQIRDIDFTMRTKEDEVNFSKLLEGLGLRKVENSPMGANRYFDPNTKAEVDFGSITYPGTIYYQIPLSEEDQVTMDNFAYRVIPKESHKRIYESILFSRGRSVRNDLIKLKILTSR